MNSAPHPPRIAILDDYQGIALAMADWSAIQRRANITVYSDHLSDPDALADRLSPYDVICVMRERTPLGRSLIERLPNLKFIASTGARNASIDTAAATEHGIAVAYTRSFSTSTVELTWALILAGSRHIISENASLRAGGWQRSVGEDLEGQTLGVIGLGNIGSRVAKVALAFGMNVIAWSHNLTAAAADAQGARRVEKQELLREADVLSIHLVLSDRTRGLIDAAELALMKRTARLINTSRGAIVVQAALIAALANGQIAGAAIDVYDVEPLPPTHPYRNIDSLLATPHIGYVSRRTYQRFYEETVANIAAWLDNRP